LNKVEWAVVDDNKGWYGSDLTHAASAWTSTSRDLTEEKRGRVDKLLKFLAEEGHTSPFEKSYFQFIVTADTASHIHIIKHRIGVSVNAESARYKEFTQDKFHVPEDWPPGLQLQLEEHTEKSYDSYHKAVKYLEEQGLSRKRAKESARYFLPFSIQVTMDVAFNFLSFAKFQKLRNDDHAQVEIHDIAQKMLDLVIETGKFNGSLRAWGLIKETE
jgi:flavin-dependent thymidylate synthase